MPTSLPPRYRHVARGPDPLKMLLCPLVMFCAAGSFIVAAMSLGHYSPVTFALAAIVAAVALEVVPGIARRMDPAPPQRRR